MKMHSLKILFLSLLISFSLETKAQHCQFDYEGSHMIVINPINENDEVVLNLQIFLADSLKNKLSQKDMLKRYELPDSIKYPLAYKFTYRLAYKLQIDLLKEADTAFSYFNYVYNPKAYPEAINGKYKARESSLIRDFIDRNVYPFEENGYFKYFKTVILTPKKSDMIIIIDPSGFYKTQYISFSKLKLKGICTSSFFSEDKLMANTIKMVRN